MTDTVERVAQPQAGSSPPGRTHRVTRRAVQVIAVVVAVLAAVGVGSFVLRDRWVGTRVQVRYGTARKTVTIHHGQPTVATVLDKAGIAPRPGRLLGVVTHNPIPGHALPARFLVNGKDTDPGATLVGRSVVVEALDGEDAIEGTVKRSKLAVPPPPIPRIERYLFHPGMAGEQDAVVGAISGEIVNSIPVVPPSVPAPVTDKTVALTFDDGPWPDTPQFLQVLQSKGVKATFCMIGRQIPPRADIVKQVVAAGMTLCNHTLNHNEHLDRAPVDLIKAELQGGLDQQVRLIGKAPVLYRPPGGALSPAVEDVAASLGEQVIGWSVDPGDYKKPGVPAIIGRVMAQVKPGAIILLHDGGGDRSQTLAALPAIIDQLKAQGYSFVTPDTVPPVPLGAASPPPPNTTPDTTPLGPEGEATTVAPAPEPPTTPAPAPPTTPPATAPKP